MKKQSCIVMVVFCALSLLFLPSCQKDAGNEQSPDDSEDPTTANNSSGSLNSADISSYDVRLGNGIGPIQFGMSREDVVRYLGEPEKLMDKGRSLMHPSKGFTLLVSPKRGVQIINCYTKVAVPPNLSAKDFQGMTTEGIAMGSTQSQIKAVYGEPNDEVDMGSQTELNYNELGIRFVLLNDGLVQFFMAIP